MCSGNNASAGKRRSGRTTKGNRWLKRILVQAAWAASHTKGTYLAAQYGRLAARRGKKRALVALGHTILVIIYHVLTRREPYRELGGAYFDQREHQHVRRRLVQRLERLGYTVSLQPATPEAPRAA
jgi:hypothetical protein